MRLVTLATVLLTVSYVAPVRRYTNEWAVEVKGGMDVAKRVAQDNSFILVGQIGNLEDHYSLRHASVSRRSVRCADDHHRRLSDDSRVVWAEQQHEKSHEKRDVTEETEAFDRLESLESGSSDGIKRHGERVLREFNDPKWGEQWYMRDSMFVSQRGDGDDVNTSSQHWTYYTGKGVVLTILDDGVEKNHTDLEQNYDPEASYDFNDEDPDPFPRWEPTNYNKHGTRCAGEIAMVANNKFCGVGVAYNSKIGGLRILDGSVTDVMESKALTYHSQHIDIMSASWGPSDKGKVVEGPGKVAGKALIKGTTEGRGGKGTLYVWASGNGGRHNDSCACDGYVSSMYTLSISGASQSLRAPPYAEPCASTIATAYSSGSHIEQKIVSSDMRGLCTVKHSGTSAAAPLAAGVMALALEANPNITWRDMQHLLALTAHHTALSHNPGWYQNGAGFWLNPMFGFGLVDASEMVAHALGWVTVPSQLRCEVGASTPDLPAPLPSGATTTITIDGSVCNDDVTTDIRYLEHAHIVVSLKNQRRGALNIHVTSPMGTTTELLPLRVRDKSEGGLTDWPFMSLHNWGEDPRGVWKVSIADTGEPGYEGELSKVSLLIYGTHDKPGYATPRDIHVAEMTRQRRNGVPSLPPDSSTKVLSRHHRIRTNSNKH